MPAFRCLLRYTTWPLLTFGFGTAIVTLGASQAGLPAMLTVLAAAVALSFAVERMIPYQPNWNRNLGDAMRDGLHAVVNLTLNRSAVWLLPLFAWMAIGGGYWPANWPFAAQVALAVLILDFGIAAAHHASHVSPLLWRFHAVHHSVKRLYGINGWMKHPLHQAIETAVGVLPLLLLGIPYDVALTLPPLVALALLGQHTNADIRTGWLKYLFANGEVHRFHHTNARNGDVNFGLFTNLYDHLAGTFHFAPNQAPRHSAQLGLRDGDDFPVGYWQQLLAPFRQRRQPAAHAGAADLEAL